LDATVALHDTYIARLLMGGWLVGNCHYIAKVSDRAELGKKNAPNIVKYVINSHGNSLIEPMLVIMA
jgi:hypothetical protein